jgi:hypothetical protein
MAIERMDPVIDRVKTLYYRGQQQNKKPQLMPPSPQKLKRPDSNTDIVTIHHPMKYRTGNVARGIDELSTY